MSRARFQKGCVEIKNGVWSGRYNDYVENSEGNVQRIGRRVRLGTTVEFPTKVAAQQKLASILERINTKYNIVLAEKKADELTLSDKGAIGELAVSIDLIYRGFEVFRNLSPSGPVDLIAMRHGQKPYRIQVKRRYNLKTISIPTLTKLLEKDYDVLAVVAGKGEVKYYTHDASFGVEPLTQICPDMINSLENVENLNERVN